MKKFLSLVLALVMTMSLVTISAGAKDFTDDTSINYEEAVKVMDLLGVINGYEDGSFKPTNTLTRGAAAKIICNLLLTPAVADTLPANNTGFKDVPTTNTFAKYIAYCGNAGIINGYGDGTFRPAGTLTGFAFMKMLLGALGYDAQIEGFTGDTFALNVASKIGELELSEGNDAFVGTKAVTREEACLYAFNMLSKNMVKYASKGSKITVNGVEIIQGASPAESTGKTFAAVKFSGLKEGAKSDDFGRNYKTWTYGKTTIKLLASKADKVYYGAVTAKKIYSDLSLNKAASYKVKVYPATEYTVMTGATFYGQNNGKQVYGNLSYMVEAYYAAAPAGTKDGETTITGYVDIIPVQYLLGRVSRVNKASGLTDRSISIWNTENGVTNKDGAVELKYTTESFAKDDVVLYTVVGTTVQDVQLAKTVEGKVTESKTGDYLTIGGVKYDTALDKDPGTEGTFYLGIDGSIIGFNGKEVVSYANYAYVYSIVDVATADDDGLKTTGKRAYFVKADGTKGNALLASGNTVTENTVVAYSINAKGEMAAATAVEGTVASNDGKFTKTQDIGKSYNKVLGAYMGNDTKFVFVSTADNKLEIVTKDGYKNVADQKADVVVVSVKGDAKVVFVDGKSSSDATDAKYGFLRDEAPSVKLDSNGNKIYVFSVMIDGNNEATLTSSDENVFKTAGVEKTYRFTYTEKDGLLDSVKPAYTSANDGFEGKIVVKAGDSYLAVKNADGTAVAGTFDLAADCITYLYDATDATYTSATVAAGDTINVYRNTKGEVTMIVITAQAD